MPIVLHDQLYSSQHRPTLIYLSHADSLEGIKIAPSDIKRDDHREYTLYGKEAQQLVMIRNAIGNREPLAPILSQIAPEYLDLLLNFCVKKNDSGDSGRYIPFWTPAHFAASKGNMEALRELAAYGADFNVKEIAECDYGTVFLKESILFFAVCEGRADVIDYLLRECKLKASKNELNELLFEAILYRSLDVVKTLIANGADINCKDKNGTTLLQYVFIRYLIHTAVALFCRQRGEDFELLTTNLIKFFLDKGADQSLISEKVKKELTSSCDTLSIWAPAFTGAQGYVDFLKSFSNENVRTFIQKLIKANLPDKFQYIADSHEPAPEPEEKSSMRMGL